MDIVQISVTESESQGVGSRNWVLKAWIQEALLWPAYGKTLPSSSISPIPLKAKSDFWFAIKCIRKIPSGLTSQIGLDRKQSTSSDTHMIIIIRALVFFFNHSWEGRYKTILTSTTEAGVWSKGCGEHSCLQLARPLSSQTHQTHQHNSGGNIVSNVKGKINLKVGQ